MFSINGYDFQNEDDVDIAREELNKIQFISDKLSDDPEAVLAVYNKMLDSKIFITPIGVEYLRQMQGYLLRSPQIEDSRVKDVPVLISYQEALHYKDLEKALKEKTQPQPVKTIPKEEPETDSAKLRRRFRFSIATIVVLVIMVAAMFVIALNSNTPNILNYRNEIENEYAQWAQELSEKEAQLRERENALNGQ